MANPQGQGTTTEDSAHGKAADAPEAQRMNRSGTTTSAQNHGFWLAGHAHHPASFTNLPPLFDRGRARARGRESDARVASSKNLNL